MNSKTLLLVEDEANTRRMLAAALATSPSVGTLDEAATFAEAIGRLEQGGVEVLVTDLKLPDGSGLDIIRRARAQSDEMPIMVITALGTEEVVLDAIAHGADGYLLKSAERTDISSALEALLAGEAPISPAIARHVLKRFRSSVPSEPAVAGASPARADAVSLSAREQEILKLMGKGIKSTKINTILNITTHTVNTHIRNIYRKLEVASRTEAVYEATRMGLLGPTY